jgi:hypothetical protein
LLAIAGEERFSLFRLEDSEGHFRLRRLRSQRGRLVRRPIVDPNGVSFIVEAPNGGLRLKRVSHLGEVPCDDEDDDESSNARPDRPVLDCEPDDCARLL